MDKFIKAKSSFIDSKPFNTKKLSIIIKLSIISYSLHKRHFNHLGFK